MYVLTRDTHPPRHYFTYDMRGNKGWTTQRLNAALFESDREARECCKAQLLDRVKLVDVGRDGEIHVYNNIELQIFQKGGVWRFRAAFFDPESGDNVYRYGRRGMPTAARALQYAKRCIDHVKK